MKEYTFPFTAIVGQEDMKMALILNAIDPRIGGVLIRGERGTAKSTAARALAALLPPQEVVSGCRFGCDPADPSHWCDECTERFSGAAVPTDHRPTPFVNLPVSVTEDRLVGTLDFEKALVDGKKHFEPGLFAKVNRGILYVDEVNLLDDHIVDTLLDAAAMGINHIEREGISFVHPASFIIIGTMNPEEGDLRPQLLDRFAHSVEIHGETDPAKRVGIITNTLAFERDPEGFCEQYAPQQQALAERITRAQNHLNRTGFAESDLYAIAELTSSFHLEGHRADIVILKTARAHAAFEGRPAITAEDIAMAAALTIPHRILSEHGPDQNISAESIREKAAVLLAGVQARPEADMAGLEDKKKLLP